MAGYFFNTPGDAELPLTPQAIDRKRKMAEALSKSGMDYSPVQHWTQGAARMANALVGGMKERDLDAKEAAGRQGFQSKLLSALTGDAPTDIRPQAQASAPIGSDPVQPVDRSQPRGIRNNNPGNIEDGGFARNLPGYVGSDGRFARFETPEAGIQAQSRLLDVYANKHGLNTVAGIVGRWAPATDGNNVSAYAANVAKQMGVDPTAPLNMSDPNVKAKLAMAMAAHENGRQAFSPETFARGVAGSPAAPSQPSAPPSQMATVNTRITGQQVPVNPDGTAADIFNPETGQPGVMAFSGPQGQAPAQGAINRAAPMPNAAAAPGQQPVAPMPQAQGNAPVAPMPNAARSPAVARMAALLSDPWASDGEKSMVMLMLKDQMDRNKPDFGFQVVGDQLFRTDKKTGAATQLGIGTGKAPTVQVIKQPDGSEVAVQWDAQAGQWQPMNAPGGGNAVTTSKLEAEAKARERIVQQQGGDPKTPQNQAFILSGRMPREDQQPLTASDKKAVLEADEAVMMNENTINMLGRAKQLSKTAMEIPLAGPLSTAGALFGNQKSIDTQELKNLVTSQALENLKATFGGAPTEGERKILLDIQGSINQPDAVRQKIYDRAIEAANRRLKFNQERALNLRGGNYYKPAEKGGPQTPGQMAPKTDGASDLKSKYGLE